MLNLFVNTWGNYNTNGADGGKWITLPMDPEELEEVLENIAVFVSDCNSHNGSSFRFFIQIVIMPLVAALVLAAADAELPAPDLKGPSLHDHPGKFAPGVAVDQLHRGPGDAHQGAALLLGAALQIDEPDGFVLIHRKNQWFPIFPEFLLRLFTSDENMVTLGVSAMNIYFFGFVFMAFQFAGQSTFQGLGKAKQAVFFALSSPERCQKTATL